MHAPAQSTTVVIVYVLALVSCDQQTHGRKLEVGEGTPTDQVIEDGIYTNHFFKFSFPIPDGWHVAGSQIDSTQLNAEPNWPITIHGHGRKNSPSQS